MWTWFRRPLRRAVLPAVALTLGLAFAGPAPAEDARPGTGKQAQKQGDAQKPAAGKQADPKPSDGAKAPPTMAVSPMTRVTFDVPPFPLGDDGTYRGFLDDLLKEYGRRCTRQEQFGWEFAKGDQTAAQTIVQATMTGFGKVGYRVEGLKPKALTDPLSLAYFAHKDSERIVVVWVPLEASLLLTMCDSGPR
ncbi:hypothetical protein [Azospirillum thermophilum]|uniref:Uncharacterized protein n=1 Tax=Azospirillum thermophilum TaxID=2202148 RepID=A0A2S2CNH4_9PROT|nr:hypothetical protein [Azospirillum thermophilum]AWK86061.1 hypothetical protein DEW08_07175 [Azospirillum thermophilum]